VRTSSFQNIFVCISYSYRVHIVFIYIHNESQSNRSYAFFASGELIFQILLRIYHIHICTSDSCLYNTSCRRRFEIRIYYVRYGEIHKVLTDRSSSINVRIFDFYRSIFRGKFHDTIPRGQTAVLVRILANDIHTRYGECVCVLEYMLEMFNSYVINIEIDLDLKKHLRTFRKQITFSIYARQ